MIYLKKILKKVNIILGKGNDRDRDDLLQTKEEVYKQIISTDEQTGGYEEFIMVDLISASEERYILVVDGNKSLCWKGYEGYEGGVWLHDDRGVVAGDRKWRNIVSYNRESIKALFGSMDQNKERWMKEGTVLVDCINYVLSNGGTPV